MSSTMENEFAKYWIENGILFFLYKKNVQIDEDAARLIVNDRIHFQNYKPYPAFADFRGVSTIDKAGRDFLAKEGSKLVSACAILIDSPVKKMMINFYLQIDKPVTPTRMFTEKTEAINWLQQFLK